ncbi:membrane protein [Thermosipho melanesiensis]|nr:membrane protein [Thermosipho melanesiensis]OOC39445.1 membrane protein [Thermosipho melanesiensis]OOC39508.1 membrane protein [Thermosipho melanesiensis]OOC42581.1 membrane protein [Thermosipho melanesiensis]OOC44801.1 membrane protein [Thermosipho melanesiensis]
MIYVFTPIVNAIAIVIGSFVGIFAKKGIPENAQKILFYAVGLSTMGLSISMILKSNNFLILLSSLAIGGIIGELLNIEGKLKKLGDSIKEGDFSTGFVTSSLLFLVGPLTIIGSITAGITKDGSLIYMKSLLDGISSIVLSSVYGLGVLLSAFSVLVVQGLFVLFASKLSFLTSPQYLNDLIATGGIMILGLGLKILDIKDTKVGNFLPALLIAPLLVYITGLF